jgi:DNA-binding protein
MWWYKLLGKTTVENEVIDIIKEFETQIKEVKKVTKKKRGRKPKKKN